MFRDKLLILLIILSTVIAVKDAMRVNSRRAQQQRMRSVKRSTVREFRLGN